jgi:L-lactate dehydrogenase complex protein LldG
VSARDAILGKLRSRLAADPRRVGEAGVTERLARHDRGLIPARAQGDAGHRVALLEAQVQALAGTTQRVSSLDEVPQAVADYLRGQNLPPRVKRAPHPLLRALPFERVPLLEVSEGRAEGSDLTSLTPVFCAVAETGTLVLQSSPQTPTTLAFLPDNHIAVVKASQVLATYEEAFDLTRQAQGEGRMPRSFNFVTGPSRTADIEQQIQLGAHGPRRLHIILVEDVPL